MNRLSFQSHRQGQLSHTQWDTFLKWYYRVAQWVQHSVNEKSELS